MKKTLVTALAVGLVAGALAGPVSAARKKPKKPKPPVAAPVQTPVTFYLTNTNAECTADSYVLMLTEATEGLACGSALSGIPNDLLVEAGEAPNTIVYNAAEGVPFVLDATQKLTGTILVDSYSHPAVPAGTAVGPTTLVVELSGESGGETKILGTAEVAYTVTPAETTYQADFEITLPAELDKAPFTTLAISLYNGGVSPLHGFYRVTPPASKIVVPTWK
jgi:hypothetical protein